jgi:ATP-dependent helicase/nuclease subunit A
MSLLDATEQQRRAADPEASTWLSANAGSGKTKVLIDRVAGLLLDQVDPQHILCLTYTKAAASEMQNRLFARLGGWAMEEDAALRADLEALGAAGPFDGERLAQARRLFARAIETPGGLRIQTIHSFCAALLRRFPLEAGVSPQFVEMEDRTAELMRDEVIEALAKGPDAGILDALAAEFTGEDLTALAAEIASHRELFPAEAPDMATILDWFGLPADASPVSLATRAFDGHEADLMAQLVPVLSGLSATYEKLGTELSAHDWAVPGWPEYATLAEHFLYKSDKQRHRSKAGNWPQSNHSAARAALDPLLPRLDALMERVAAVRQDELSLAAARRAHVLHRFAAAFLPAYAARKAARGFLDFDDLILKTRQLLTDPAVAGWVLYRLDGGIDHILVDEAQDTSPVQWQVIERLAEEMVSGEGAHSGESRTLFVVGDRKQSIYSFQGADPAEFDRMQAEFASRLASGSGLQRLILPFSFRSSEAVLRAVDATFAAHPPAAGMIEESHRAIHPERPGRVDLWPWIEESDAPEDGPWFDPVDRVAEDHHSVRLARTIAEACATMIGAETLPEKDGRRPVRAGDIMILVQRRSDLFHEIIRALKERDLPVAGADRLRLGGELAVKDLAALLSFLALQEDDLSLAAALRSPLFGWSEAELFDLAHGRKGYLWQALRDARKRHPDTLAMLDSLRRDADFLRPYDLIDRILTRHDGRRRLLARLGQEAMDGIDALLQQALAYERAETPSLTGFLAWLETDDVEIKRQLDTAGDRIRVMTVHGAKGLESGIVILPDTAKRRVDVRAQVLPLAPGAPVWRGTAETLPSRQQDVLDRMKAAQEEERLRLLYVAMTRAESWLIVCGAGQSGDTGESWYRLVEAGLTHAGAVGHDFALGDGLRLSSATWEGPPLVSEAQAAAVTGDLPDWAKQRAPARPKPPAALNPSDLGGSKTIPGETDAPGETEAALRRGRLIHLLLEHLPLLPREAWPDLARDLLAVGEDAVTNEEADLLLSDARRVLEAPDLAPLFSPAALAEVALTADLPELGGRIRGAIDRLLVEKDRVLAVDYKTNRLVPATPAQVPDGILRQMAAYRSALLQIYPGRGVEVAVLWTAEARLMPLPDDILRTALEHQPTS